MSYDLANNKVILFGGYNNTYLGDTWFYGRLEFFKFNFKQGWDFITLPLVMNYKRAGDLLAAIQYSREIKKWDCTNQD